MDSDVSDLIQRLQLAPHPEGGHYRRIYSSAMRREGRPVLSGIRFLLAEGEGCRWHRLDGDECWHWQQGGVLELLTCDPATGRFRRELLGPEDDDVEPMRVVPAGVWQAARPIGSYVLVACTGAPAFLWDSFSLLDARSALASRLREQGDWVA